LLTERWLISGASAGRTSGGSAMKVYMLMMLVSMILASAYWAKSDDASVIENA
jgi:hypothetical protein